MILTVTLNPCIDHALFVDQLQIHDTNRVRRVERDAGGKGINLARVAAEMGADVVATGFLGGGPGAYIRSVLDKQYVDHDFTEIAGETRINFCVEDGTHEAPTTFNEPGPNIAAQELERLRSICKDMARTAKWICIGGSIPPGLSSDVFKTLIEDCKSVTCSVVLDADGEPMKLGMQAGPTFVKPNAKEAGRLLGMDVNTLDDCLTAAKEILFLLQQKETRRKPFVVLSRGTEGAVLAAEGQLLVGHTPKVEVNSTIGSGDSLIGAMLWAIEEGKSLEESFRWGMAAGAATAMTGGSEIARKPVVLQLFQETRAEVVEQF